MYTQVASTYLNFVLTLRFAFISHDVTLEDRILLWLVQWNDDIVLDGSVTAWV